MNRDCGCGTFSRGSPFFLPFSLPLLFCCAVRRRLLFCADTAEVLLERCSIFVPAFSVQLQHDSISSCPGSLFMQLFTIDSVVTATQEGSRFKIQEPTSKSLNPGMAGLISATRFPCKLWPNTVKLLGPFPPA